jgi:hypothetical protein
VTFATATRGEGVADSFVRLLEAVYRRNDDDCGLSARHGLSIEAFMQAFLRGAQGTM